MPPSAVSHSSTGSGLDLDLYRIPAPFQNNTARRSRAPLGNRRAALRRPRRKAWVGGAGRKACQPHHPVLPDGATQCHNGSSQTCPSRIARRAPGWILPYTGFRLRFITPQLGDPELRSGHGERHCVDHAGRRGPAARVHDDGLRTPRTTSPARSRPPEPAPRLPDGNGSERIPTKSRCNTRRRDPNGKARRRRTKRDFSRR